MLLMILVALLALIFGLLFLFSPEILRKMNKKASEVISKTDDTFLENRILVGLILIILSLIMFYIGFGTM